MNVPSIKHSDRSISPRIRKSSARASSTLRSVPSRDHCWNRRWDVWYGGKLLGKTRQRAPPRRNLRTPLLSPRGAFHGRARPSSPRGGLGVRGAVIVPLLSVYFFPPP